MNHLAHLHLAGEDQGLIVGGFLGDFVRGKLVGRLPEEIEKGIALHRAIDAYTDQHLCVGQSKARFRPETRRFAPIIVDIAYDHFLANHWFSFYPRSLEDFSEQRCNILHAAETLLPAAALNLSQSMRQKKSLLRYGTVEFVSASLKHLSGRLRRPNNLAAGFDDFQLQKQHLEEDFLQFYPQLISFRDQWLKQNMG